MVDNGLLRTAQPSADPWWVRLTLTTAAIVVLGLLVAVPVVNVFFQALAEGLGVYWDSLTADPATLHAMGLTLIVSISAVVLNLIFGIAAAWAIARVRFPGRTFLLTLIDIPFSVSPVVAGLVFVLLFAGPDFLGPWLREHHIRIIGATSGLILATAFVTLPFVARELIPVLEAVGPEEELAAASLGANCWQIFWRVTLPNIKWGLLYGIILCNARAMGEFGAVRVVSGNIEGQSQTLPLRVNMLFQDSKNAAAFAVASLLTLLALVTLLLKVTFERRVGTKAMVVPQELPPDKVVAEPAIPH
jgi:sulfate/thiosulfate transport system permease protein